MSNTQLIDDFKRQLEVLPINEVVNLVINQSVSNGISIDDVEYIRSKIAQKLNISADTIYIVGSAKLGFSISQKKDKSTKIINKHRYRYFNEESDIDFAIVNSQLFDEYWQDIFITHCRDTSWQQRNEFQHFFFRGWIRPDKFPASFQKGIEWWELFSNLSRDVKIRRRVRGGLYKSISFLRAYQEICIVECLNEIKLGE